MGTVIPFVPPLDPVTYGLAEQVSPMIRRIIAENPSKYSYRGTGTYIVGRGRVAVIDPGPDLPSHREALTAALVAQGVPAVLQPAPETPPTGGFPAGVCFQRAETFDVCRTDTGAKLAGAIRS